MNSDRSLRLVYVSRYGYTHDTHGQKEHGKSMEMLEKKTGVLEQYHSIKIGPLCWKKVILEKLHSFFSSSLTVLCRSHTP